jgi:alkanesulfonate monooxygenase
MAVKILWYLTAPDGIVPWEPDGRWSTGFPQMQQLATTIDRLGYYGALLATGADEVNTLAASMVSITSRMKFVAAVYPGLIAPAKLAQIAQTINRFSGGRLIYNAVNGNDAMLPAQGIHLTHDERYEYSLEYWEAFSKLYTGSTEGFAGKHIQIAPKPKEAGGGGQRGAPPPKYDHFPLWGAGSSSAGVEHSVRLLDLYLSFAHKPQVLGDKFRRVGAAADKLGRKLEFGTRLQVIVRETEEEAWAFADYLVSRTSVEYARQCIQRQLPKGETIDSYQPEDSQVRRNLDVIRGGKLPPARDYEIYPNVWTGPALHGFNVLGPLSGTTLVGSAENVAARIREFEAQGTHAFILSGWPLIEEAYRFANLVFPLLDLDHGFEVSLLSPSRRRVAPAPVQLRATA